MSFEKTLYVIIEPLKISVHQPVPFMGAFIIFEKGWLC